jgi:hypothetical protein
MSRPTTTLLYFAFATALGDPPGGNLLGNKLSYQAKFDFQVLGPKADPPKVVSVFINQVLPCWSDQLNSIEL